MISNNKLGRRRRKEEFMACFKSLLNSVPGGDEGDE
jgi:hypothetical protein